MSGSSEEKEEENEPLICDHQSHDQDTQSNNKLSLIPLIFLIYFEVSGGPYGEENTVGAAGPLFAIVGFLVFPFVWSIPEALITAELSTAFPGNGGFVVWAHEAFGPFWATLMATWKFLSGVINLASCPVLCADYLEKLVPALASGLPRYAALTGATVLLSVLNYTGLTVVGHTAVALGVVSYLPFLVMSLMSVPAFVPARLVYLGAKKRNWTLFFNTLFWNLNCWDNASTLAGEFRSPRRTFPKALLSAVILTLLGYLLPLIAAIGSVPDFEQEKWRDGYLAVAAEIIAGRWLKIWMGISTVLSVVGMFEAQLTTSAYQILGMAELGIIPSAFGERSRRFGTPWVGILVAVVVPVSISYMDFTVIISAANFVYALGMLLELASFLWLRKKLPAAKRPFKVPLDGGWAVAMCVAPCVFLVWIMCTATGIVALISGLVTLFGVAFYLFLNLCRTRMWFLFNHKPPLHHNFHILH